AVAGVGFLYRIAGDVVVYVGQVGDQIVFHQLHQSGILGYVHDVRDILAGDGEGDLLVIVRAGDGFKFVLVLNVQHFLQITGVGVVGRGIVLIGRAGEGIRALVGQVVA